MRLSKYFSCVLVIAAGLVQVSAQSAFSIRGSVVDTTGAGVPGMTVLLETASGTVVSQARSGRTGDFALLGIPAGAYVLVVPESAHFAAYSAPLQLKNSVSSLKVPLSLAVVTQDISVSAESVLSTDASANQDTVAVTSSQLSKLPSLDLDYVSTLSSFLDASSGSSGGTTLVVDGIEMKSAGVSPSAIQEVRVNNDPFSTEFNRPGRGRIEIITKPGSPQYHGEYNFLLRNGALNAMNYFAQKREPETRYLSEGHFTGPIGYGGHTNFIASGEYGTRSVYSFVNATLGSGVFYQNVLSPRRNGQATLRLTHDFSPAHRLQVGYNFEMSTDRNSGVGGLVLEAAGTNGQGREDDLIFNDRILVNAHVVNQLLVTLEKDEDETQSTTSDPSIVVNGAFTQGGAQADQGRTENTVHVNEVVSWTSGRHYLRFGIQLPQFSRRAVDDRTNRQGTYSFANLSDYPATPYSFTIQQGPGRGIYWMNEFGAFVQDQIKISEKLQATLGLRYDWQTFLDDRNNLAPRFSIAYAPGKSKTILRAGSGVFYDRTGGDFPSNIVLHNGAVLYTAQFQNPAYPLVVGTNLTSVPSNIARFAAGVRTPYMFLSTIGIERQFDKKLTVTAAYRNMLGVKSFRSRDANAPTLPADPVLAVDYPRPNPSLGQVQQIESGGRLLMNALDLSLRGDLRSWFSGQIQYTLARAESNTGGIKAFPQDQYHPNNEWGRTNDDRLQAFNMAGEINPGHWMSLGINAALYSGSPYTETTGNDNYHTGLGNARPQGVGRNSLQGAGQINLDLSWQHDFRLSHNRADQAKTWSAGVAAINVLNHPNFSGFVGDVGSALFTQPTTALSARQLQFSFGYRF